MPRVWVQGVPFQEPPSSVACITVASSPSSRCSARCVLDRSALSAALAQRCSFSFAAAPANFAFVSASCCCSVASAESAAVFAPSSGICLSADAVAACRTHSFTKAA